jgi:hypothetical protein
MHCAGASIDELLGRGAPSRKVRPREENAAENQCLAALGMKRARPLMQSDQDAKDVTGGANQQAPEQSWEEEESMEDSSKIPL